jgi:hypothetical protein
VPASAIFRSTFIQSRITGRNLRHSFDAEDTFSRLWEAIVTLIDLFVPKEPINFFAAAGYDAD